MQLLKPSWVSYDGRALMTIDIHPDGQRFAVGGQGVDCGRISIFNLKPIQDEAASKDKNVPTLLTQMDHHEGCVNCVRWSHRGNYLASAADDKLIMIWEKSAYGGGSIFGSSDKVHVESWRLRSTLRGHNGDVLHVAWSPNDDVLASASVDNTIMIWNAEKFPELVTTLKGHVGLVKGVVFDPIGKFLASQSDDKTLRIWRTSDWSEETVIEKPFIECGATTHVLRLDWSPDGSFLVSAHAMNGGGPTAQIIDRNSWKTNRDFVGHRKAVSCVRFNSAIFERTGSNGKVENYATVALGSRDRSFSVWSTHLKRPFFVVNDVFEQAVSDISWSKDGKTLLACSMDGTVAAAIFSTNEIGTPLSEEKLHDLMTQIWGKSFAQTNIINKGKQNGTVIIEDPSMLKLSANGHATSKTSSLSTPTKASVVFKGPTDKQIEARTSDGKRRITPIFIPPPTVENGSTSSSPPIPFGSAEFGSSSTQAKSKITVEKREDIVAPNISPGKPNIHESNSLMAKRCPPSSDQSQSAVTKFGDAPEKKVKQDEEEEDVKPEPVKPQPAETPKPVEPPVNIIQVKRKPGPAAPPVTSQAQTTAPLQKDPQVTNGDKSKSDKSLLVQKKRSGRVILDSSDDEEKEDGSDESSSSSSSSGSSGSESSESEDEVEVTDKTKKESESNRPDTARDKLKDSRLKKPDIVSKRKIAEPEEKSRKRIRPLPQRDTSLDATNGLPESSRKDEPVFRTEIRRLPELTVSKSALCSFTVGAYKVVVTVSNYVSNIRGNSGLHKVSCSVQGTLTWETLLFSPVCAVANGTDFVVVACQDGTLHIFSSMKGEKKFPPFVLDSGISKMTVSHSRVAVVTVDARLYAWDLQGGKAIMRGESIASLLAPGDFSPSNISVKISKLNFCSKTQQLVVVTTAGKSYIYNDMLATWLKISDTSSSVQTVSDYSTAAANLPTETKGHPLASLSYLTPTVTPRIQNISDEIRVAASVVHCQDQVDKIRSHLEELLGPVSSGSESTWEKTILGLDKRTLLKDALKIISGNIELQRLYTEFNEQLSSATDLKEIDALLDI